MATVCSPVTIVTTTSATSAGRVPFGTTVSAFASLSLRPPMVTVALDRDSRLLGPVLAAETFGVNVLGQGQEETATLFARRGTDRFASSGLRWRYDHDLPRLDGAPGWLVCDLARAVEGGDHVLLLGAVRAAQAQTAQAQTVPPLVYGHRAYGTHSGFATRPAAKVSRSITDLIAACSH
jgi:flavin reductase (DIM6/NTAB) family NADH-FMN oxidoreductase RutF